MVRIRDTISGFLVLCSLSLGSSSSSSPSQKSSPGLAGSKPDSFVQAAPLVVGAVCQDGVVLLAAHIPDEAEPLLFDNIDTNENEDDGSLFVMNDLPPSRIRSVDGLGTTIVTCGWRADGDTLWEEARNLAATEVGCYGPPSPISYGSWLSSELALFLAQCELSDKMRAPSAVGLLAFSCSPTHAPPLWLVDPTGAYAVNYLCLGGGTGTNGEPLAKTIQQKLRAMPSLQSQSCSEGVRTLRDLLLSSDKRGSPFIKSRTRWEVAAIKSGDTKAKLVKL